MDSKSTPNNFIASEQGAATEKRQPWLAIWPRTERSDSKQGQINYAYSQGTKMIVPGSAGEWNWTIAFDTGDKTNSA